jgi:hypothetical protein
MDGCDGVMDTPRAVARELTRMEEDAPAVQQFNAHRLATLRRSGYRVRERWHRFENFLAEVRECPPGLSVDRGHTVAPTAVSVVLG